MSKTSKKKAIVIKLDISPEKKAELQQAENQLRRNSYQLGKEVHPEIWHVEEPCICIRADIKFPSVVVNGHRIRTPYGIVYALHFHARPGKGSCISHQCGRGPKCDKGPNCIEPSHLHIVTTGENNEKAKCHNRIEDDVSFWEKTKAKKPEDREGTFFWPDCKHPNRPCFKNYGRL